MAAAELRPRFLTECDHEQIEDDQDRERAEEETGS
jgi:hypothetical protein